MPAFGLKALSALTEAELQQELLLHGAEGHGATVDHDQMRETVRHFRWLRGVPDRTSVKGLSAMKRDELAQKAAEKGIDPVGKTVTQLRLALQGWDAASAAATGKVAAPATRIAGADVVGFGQHKGETYRNILVNRPFYATWVVSTKSNSETVSPALNRLALYLEANGVAPQMGVDGAEVEILESTELEMPESTTTRTEPEEPDDSCAMFL